VAREQQPAHARAATIAGHEETALAGSAVVEAGRDSSIRGSFDAVDSLIPLKVKHHVPRSATPCLFRERVDQ
jgi:hypothetical protein